MEAPALFFSSIIPTSIYRASEIGIIDDCLQPRTAASRRPSGVRRTAYGRNFTSRGQALRPG